MVEAWEHSTNNKLQLFLAPEQNVCSFSHDFIFTYFSTTLCCLFAALSLSSPFSFYA
jgi:hypothetical protein